MKMTYLEYLLRRESFKDDIARLMYADWLDGQGDPRGELIRINVELEQTSESVGLEPCLVCNPTGERSGYIHPTGCKSCQEESGWQEKTGQAARKHYNELVERRLEILHTLPKRWYLVETKEWDQIGHYGFEGFACVLAGDEEEALRTVGISLFVHSPQAVARLMQAAVPF